MSDATRMGGAWAAIVVSYNPGPELDDCLRSLIQCGPSQLIVWDNSPTNRVHRNLGGEFPDVTFLGDGTNHGFGVANNMALEMVDLHIKRILLVNPDCLVNAATVDGLSSTLETSRCAAIVTPQMKYPNGRLGIAGGPFPTMTKELFALTRIDELLPSSWRPGALRLYSCLTKAWSRSSVTYASSLRGQGPVVTDWVSGYCMYCRRDALENVRGFDRRFFLYFEDVDLCMRLREAGYFVYVDRDAVAVHSESVSTNRAGKNRLYWMGFVMYLDIHGSRPQRAVARALSRILS